MKLRKVIQEGEEVYQGYGLAWRLPYKRVSVCYPIPLNWVFRFFRDVYWRLMMGNQREDIFTKVYNAGFRDGSRNG